MRPNGSIPTRDEIIAYLTSILTPAQNTASINLYLNGFLSDRSQLNLALLLNYFNVKYDFVFTTVNPSGQLESSNVYTKYQAVRFFDQLFAYATAMLDQPSSRQISAGWFYDYGASTTAADYWSSQNCDGSVLQQPILGSPKCKFGFGEQFYQRSPYPFVYLDDPSSTNQTLTWQENTPIKPQPKLTFYSNNLPTGKIDREDIRSDLTAQFTDTRFFEQPLIQGQNPIYWVEQLIFMVADLLNLSVNNQNTTIPQSIQTQSKSLINAPKVAQVKSVFNLFLNPRASVTLPNPTQGIGEYVFTLLTHTLFDGKESVTIKYANLLVDKLRHINTLRTLNRPIDYTSESVAVFSAKPPGIVVDSEIAAALNKNPNLGAFSSGGLDPLSFFVQLAYVYKYFGFGYGAVGTPTRSFVNNATYKNKGAPLLRMYSQWLVNRFGGSTNLAPRPNWQDEVPTESFKRAQFFVPTANIGTSYDFLLDYLGQDGVVIKGRAGEVLPEEPIGSEITPFDTGSQPQPTVVAQSQKSSKSNIVWWVLGLGVVGGGGYYLWKRNKSK